MDCFQIADQLDRTLVRQFRRMGVSRQGTPNTYASRAKRNEGHTAGSSQASLCREMADPVDLENEVKLAGLRGQDGRVTERRRNSPALYVHSGRICNMNLQFIVSISVSIKKGRRFPELNHHGKGNVLLFPSTDTPPTPLASTV